METALENRHALDGHELKVRKEWGSKAACMFVDEIPAGIGEEKLEGYFSKWGTISQAKIEDRSLFGRVVAVTGNHLSGKTATLFYVTSYAKENNWLVLATHGDEFRLEKMGYLRPNPRKSGIYDQALYTAELFKRFLATEKTPLQKINLKLDSSKRRDWTQNETKTEQPQPEGKTLYDLVSLGARNPSLAPEILEDFINEIYLVDEVPVLVVIDRISGWDMRSDYFDPAKTTNPNLSARQLGLVDAFARFQQKAPPHGTTLWAISAAPHYLNRKIHTHLQEASRHVVVPPYTDEQLVKTLAHYSVSVRVKTLARDVNSQWIGLCKAYTGNVPGEVWKYCGIAV